MLRNLVLVSLAVVVLLGGAPGTQAGDVPDAVKKWYDQAQTLHAKGSHKKALSAISKGKSKNPESVDFWELYVRIWRALDKKEKVLWEKVIPKAEKKIPGTAVFDLLQARLATSTEERIAHLKAAIEKKPEDVEPQLLLAREHLKDGDDVTAEEMLDEILEKQPGNEAALVTKGDLMIESGRSRSALNYVEEALEEHDVPGLHDLAARAMLLVAENDKSKLEEAKAEAEKAVAARPDPAFVVTLACCIDKEGKVDEAAKLLGEHYAKTKAPVIAVKLGEFDFRQGHYGKAIEHLGVEPNPDLKLAKVLAYCHARLGNKKMASQLIEKASQLGQDEENIKLWTAQQLAGIDDYAGALKALEGEAGDGADYTRAHVLSMKGDVEGTKALVAEKAKTGSRGGEEWLLHLARALVMQKLGGKAKSAQAAHDKAFIASAKAEIARADVPDESTEELPKANSVGFMQRYASYRRTIGNQWFTPTGNVSVNVDQENSQISVGIVAQAECPFESQRGIYFNREKFDGQLDPQKMIAVIQELMGGEGAQAWAGAVKSFQGASAAFVEGDWAAAIEGYSKAIEAEPSWGRAWLFRAVAKAMSGDKDGASQDAAEAAKFLPDDWDGRGLGVYVRELAGKDASGERKALAERFESYIPRRMDLL